MSFRERIQQKLGSWRSERARAIGLFFASSLAARGVGIGCQILQVPLALHAFGGEAFGFWMTLSSYGMLIAFADFGIGLGVQNRMAEAWSTGDVGRARQVVCLSVALFGVLTLALLTLLIPLAWCFNFAEFFGLQDPTLIREAPLAIAATIGTFCAALPFGLAQRIAQGQQRGWMHNVAQAIGSVVALGALYLVVRSGDRRITVLILSATIPPILANAALLVQLVHGMRPIRLRDFGLSRPLVRDLLSLGGMFGIQQVATFILNAAPQIILARALGAAAVTPYNLAQRLFNLFSVAQNALMLPLWPAYSEANARGEYGWMRRTLRRSIVATCGMSILPMILAGFFARPLFRLWVGPEATLPSPTLVWLLLFWNAMLFIQQPFSYLLAGVSEIRRVAIYSASTAVLSLVMMNVLVRVAGAPGLVVGMLVGYVPVLFVGCIVEAQRFLRNVPPAPTESPLKMVEKHAV